MTIHDIPSDKDDIENFSLQLAQQAVDAFWQEPSPALDEKEVGVRKEDLLKKVAEDMRHHMGRTRGHIRALLQGSSDRERAYEDLEGILKSTAQVSVTRSYEALVFEKKAGIDDLTGLPTRKVFNANLKLAIESHRRFGHKFSLIFFDLDRFKRVNDTHGHIAGDMVLVEMARRLSEDAKLRGVDSLARFGGEEFVVLLPETPKEGAAILAQRISDQIGAKPFKVVDIKGKEIQLDVTASIGISEYKTAEIDPDGTETISRADDSLYVLKGGRPDTEGITADRRGQIACEGKVLTRSEIEGFKLIMMRSGRRTSLPPKSE